MERDIFDILKAFEDGKLTIIETHKKLCGMIINPENANILKDD